MTAAFAARCKHAYPVPPFAAHTCAETLVKPVMETSHGPVSAEETRWSAGCASRHYADARPAAPLSAVSPHHRLQSDQISYPRASEVRFILRLPDPVERLARDAVLSQKEAQLGRMFLDVAQGVQLELEKAHRLPPPPGESNLAVRLLV